MSVRPSQVERLADAEVAFTRAHNSRDNASYNRAAAVLTAAKRNSSKEEIAAAVKEHNKRLGIRSNKS